MKKILILGLSMSILMLMTGCSATPEEVVVDVVDDVADAVVIATNSLYDEDVQFAWIESYIPEGAKESLSGITVVDGVNIENLEGLEDVFWRLSVDENSGELYAAYTWGIYLSEVFDMNITVDPGTEFYIYNQEYIVAEETLSDDNLEMETVDSTTVTGRIVFVNADETEVKTALELYEENSWYLEVTLDGFDGLDEYSSIENLIELVGHPTEIYTTDSAIFYNDESLEKEGIYTLTYSLIYKYDTYAMIVECMELVINDGETSIVDSRVLGAEIFLY